MKIIMPQQAHEKIEGTDGKIFSVVFRRKRDKVERDKETGEKKIVARAGDLRKMNCRTKVTSRRKTPNGEGRAYKFSDYDLVSVFDLQADGYRTFAWANIVFLHVNGEEYIVLSDQTLAYCRDNPDSDVANAVQNAGIEF